MATIMMNVSGWQRRQSNRAKKVAVMATAFYAAHPEVVAALLCDHPILRDMARKVDQFGSLSDKQIAFALKLADEVKNPKPAEAHVPAPTGRQTITGTVVSVKEHFGQFGSSLKMTVKVSTPEGSWLAWSTVPESLKMDHVAFVSTIEDSVYVNIFDWLKGKTVRFDANLIIGKDAHFAFAKRPTNAAVIA